MLLLLLIVALLFLWLGTEVLIRAALKVADHYNFSHVFIGLTILAVGTDLPELVLSISASLKSRAGVDAGGVIIGNVIGSAIAQISFVLGIAGLAGFLTLTKKEVKREGLIMIASIFMTYIVLEDNRITMPEGLALVIAYLVYYISLLSFEKVNKKIQAGLSKVWPSFIYMALGGILVIFSSEMAIEYTLRLAEKWEVDQTFISILIIGLGTSLPELAVSLNAVLKGSPGLSVGNLIGSNIFDMLVPVGVGAAIFPIGVDSQGLIPDFLVLLGVSALALVFFFKKKGLQKMEAISLIVIYAVYASYKIIDGLA